MTFVSVAEATTRLSIDAKTLRRWLAQAQLALHSHPYDGRKKGVSQEHLQVLARLHQRSLTPFPQEPSAPVPGSVPSLPAALLALPEQLSALQAQVAALQQQVADLSRLLTQHKPEPARWHRRSPARPSIHPGPHALVPLPRPPPKRLPSRFMSSRAWSMAMRGTI